MVVWTYLLTIYFFSLNAILNMCRADPPYTQNTQASIRQGPRYTRGPETPGAPKHQGPRNTSGPETPGAPKHQGPRNTRGPETPAAQKHQGPRNTRGPPCSQRGFHFSFVLNLASGYENMNGNFMLMRCCRPFYVRIS